METLAPSHNSDIFWMRRALVLARRGRGLVQPNPMVGAIIVNDGRLVGQGWHRQAGGPHAEIEALNQAGAWARGSTMYVTLEPCNHFGRTPPCTAAICAAGLRRLVVAMRDPNPGVKGGGVEEMLRAGIEVRLGILEREAQEMNCYWSYWTTNARPFVVLRLLLSLGGRVVPETFSPRHRSLSRTRERRVMQYADALMLDAETARPENLLLSQSPGDARKPLRVLIDEELKLGADVYSRLGRSRQTGGPPVLAIATTNASHNERLAVEQAGVEVAVLDDGHGEIDWPGVLNCLGQRGVQGIFCAMGAAFTGRMLELKLANRLFVLRVSLLSGSGQEFRHGGGAEQLRLIWARKAGLDALAMYELRA